MDVINAGEIITLSEGATMTANYRASYPTAIKAHLVGKNRINAILDQSNCDGIRIYHGKDAEGAQQIVLVGVDKEGNDMTSGVIVDRTIPCPSYCPTSASPLNG